MSVTFRDRWDENDLTWMFGQFEELFRRGDRYALIVDTADATNPPNPLQRRMIMEWDNANTANTERCNVGAAVVFSSAVIRGTLTAIGWLVRRRSPVTYVATTSEAAAWCAAKLMEAGVPISEEARGYFLTKGVELA